MKPTTAILLIVVLLIVMGLIVTRQLHQQRDQPPAATYDVWAAQIEDVESMTITPAEGRALKLTKSDDKWRISEPMDAAADQYQVEGVVGAVKALTFERRFESQDSDAPDGELTGLAQPRWRIALTDKSGAKHVLHVGRAVPLSGGRKTYVKTAQDPRTCVVAVDLASKLDRPLSEFRDKTVLQLDKSRIVKISLTGRQKLELRKRDGLWGIDQPVSTAADSGAVEQLLDKFARLRVDRFIDDEPASLRPYGLEAGQERLVVQVSVAPEQTATEPETKPALPLVSYGLALGSKTEQTRYAKLVGSPGVFLVRHGLLDDLQVTLADLRDKRVISIARQDVLRVELDIPAGVAELVKTDDIWRMVKPFAGQANGDAVDRLLAKIDALAAVNIRDNVESLAKFGLESPAGKITIHQAGKSDKITLLIGATSPSGEMTFLKRQAGNNVSVVKTAQLKDILADPAGYWATRLVRLPAGSRVESLTLRRRAGMFALNRRDGTWKMSAPLAADVDTQNVQTLISKLADLRAERIVAIGPVLPAKYAEAKKIMELEFTVAQPAPTPTTSATQPATQPAPVLRTYKLRLAKLAGDVYAWLPGADLLAVGQCKGELWAALAAELRHRGIWKIEPDKIEKIELVAGADKLALLREGGGWTYTPDPYVEIDAGKVAKFLKGIQEVQAERFIVHGQADAKRFALDKPWFTLALTDAIGRKYELTVSHKGANKTANRYAQASGVPGVAVISGETAAKMAMKLDDFKE